MRTIEKKMVSAFYGGYEWHESNTRVYKMLGSWYVDLHGNTIARRDPNTNKVYFSCCGWHTSTTRSRLQALGCPCRIKDYTMIRTDTNEVMPDTLTPFNL